MGYFAQATTDGLGRQLNMSRGGWDTTTLTAQRLGTASEEARHVSVNYFRESTLAQALTGDKFAKYNLLVNILIRDEGFAPDTVAKFYNGGRRKAAMIGGKVYCIEGSKYYGDISKSRKIKLFEDDEELG